MMRRGRRSLTIPELGEKMVRAIGAVEVRHLGRGPRKAQGIEAPSGGETVKHGSTEGESPVPQSGMRPDDTTTQDTTNV